MGGAAGAGGTGAGHALGIDVGGTFTDVAVVRGDGRAAVAKVLSTHRDPVEAAVRGARSALRAARADPGRVERVVHATTLATNAVLERTGERVAHLSTAGFDGVLGLGRYARVEEDRYDLGFDPPGPPVPAEDRFEVPERVGPDGTVLAPLDEDAVRAVARTLARRGVRAVSVCLLHSYADPGHERRTARILRDELGPGAFIALSSDVWPEPREYERAATTLMSAYVGPLLGRYLSRLEEALHAIGVRAPLQVTDSRGDVMSARGAVRRAVATIESGPAAGVLAARDAAVRAGAGDAISFDMGGTTAKACVIRGGEPDITREFHVGGRGSFGGRRAGTGVPIAAPAIDLAEVGAGGGSIAWIDGAGTLRVGPRSAGSDPGPACYGRGGEEPTVTDADLVLGHLDPDAFAGGGLPLSAALAGKAVDRLAGPLGVPRERAAQAVREIADAAMGAAVHVVTVQRGIDPRGLTLVAFGGAGPVHAAGVADRFGIGTVAVPPRCGAASAAGLLFAELGTERVRSLAVPGAELAVRAGEVEEAFTALAGEACAGLGVRPDAAGVRVLRSADVRFTGQTHRLAVPFTGRPLTPESAGAALAEAAERFADRHRAAYGVDHRGPVEFTAFRVRAVAPAAGPAPHPPESGAAPAAPAAVRRALFPGPGAGAAGTAPWTGWDTPFLPRSALAPGARLPGPAVLTDDASTIAVPPGWTAAPAPDGGTLLVRGAAR
ncbi:hydantoinase/oxoprolinase family protein [Nocardiopsis sp. CNT-189]|uniref:hydantoinase/oxoprolinase family protein n=1 Tax=Nocardiopsis oceanisediminis TaxID=2816862 RepID=UPI003B387F97